MSGRIPRTDAQGRPVIWLWGVCDSRGRPKSRGTAATMGRAQAAAQAEMGAGDRAVVESAALVYDRERGDSGYARTGRRVHGRLAGGRPAWGPASSPAGAAHG